MDIQVEKQRSGPCEYELTVTVPATVMTERVTVALDELARKANLPGFRPGRVPRKVIAQKFGESVTSEAVSETLQEAYRDAFDQSELNAVSPGEMTDVQYEQGNPLTFKVKIEIAPEFELPNLSEVSVELLEPSVEEEDIAEALDGLRESHAILTPLEGPADRDCVVTADLQELDKTGVAIVGRVRRDLELDLSRVNLGDDFTGKIVGLSAGQSAMVELPGSGGKQAETPNRFQVTVKNVRRKELPALDDDFARTVNSRLSGLDDLREDLQKYLGARAAYQARERMFRTVVDVLLRKVDFPVPPRMLDAYLDRLLEEGRGERKEAPDTEEIKRFKEEYRAQAVWNLRWYLLRKRIITDRGVEVTDEEYAAEIERLARMDNRSVGDFKKRLTEEQADHIREDILERKVLALIQSEIQTIPQPVSLAEFEGRTPGRVVTA
ncbi:trigger factor [bacterium]|nr:trigger factor [bacterium]MBU1982963.1 trigger factor [bacterium]